MNLFSSKLLQQAKVFHPEFSSAIRSIPAQNIVINYSLELSKYSHNKKSDQHPQISQNLSSSSLVLTNNSPTTIKKGNNIALFQANSIFSSTILAGANNKQAQNIEQKLQELSKQYQMFQSVEMMTRTRLALSIMANRSDPDMLLYDYANFLMQKHRYLQVSVKLTKSAFLKNLTGSNKTVKNTAFQFLNTSVVSNTRSEDFSIAFDSANHFSKLSEQNRVIFPYSQYIPHSFQANCGLKALYLTHRRQNFLVLHSIRDISPGQELTLNHGNQSNYMLFMKYGFTVKQNPFSEFVLPLDYSKIDKIFNAQMQWKIKMIKKIKNTRLKNFIRIDANGYIFQDDLNMLKIVFCEKVPSQEELQSSKFNLKLEKSIYNFVGAAGAKALRSISKMQENFEKNQATDLQYQKQINLKENQQILRHLRTIENEEIIILNRLVQTSKKIITQQ